MCRADSTGRNSYPVVNLCRQYQQNREAPCARSTAREAATPLPSSALPPFVLVLPLIHGQGPNLLCFTAVMPQPLLRRTAATRTAASQPVSSSAERRRRGRGAHACSYLLATSLGFGSKNERHSTRTEGEGGGQTILAKCHSTTEPTHNATPNTRTSGRRPTTVSQQEFELAP